MVRSCLALRFENSVEISHKQRTAAKVQETIVSFAAISGKKRCMTTQVTVSNLRGSKKTIDCKTVQGKIFT